ncbi:MAG: hypothetical protein FWC58_07110 [Desulfobulbus sp.]|nr:hypothetical protein [Desulfobulbus sp.]
MKFERKFFLFVICGASLAGCKAVDDGLAAMNNGSRTANPTGPSAAAQGGVYVPPETMQITRKAFSPAPDQKLNQMIASAQPTIEKVVGLIACGAKGNRLGQYTDPGSSASMVFVSPLITMQYHKSGCLNPIRVAGWEKKSANALSFIVDYVSPQSEESVRRNYTVIQQPTGEWLFR